MRKLLALAFLSLSVANANAQYLNVSPQGLTAGSTPVSGCTSLELFYNNAGTLGCMAGTSWDNTNRSLTISGATLTDASQPVLNLSQTWNNAATIFNGIYLNIVDTASAASSIALRLDIGSGPIFRVTKAGSINASGGFFGVGNIQSGTNTGLITIGASSDVLFSRKAAANWQFGNADAAAPVAQTLSVQSVVAGTSNTAGTLWTNKGSAGTGTGVGGNVKWQLALAGGSGTAQNSFTDALTLDASAAVPRITAGGPITSKGYTVAALPTGVAGDRAYVTDQLTACPVLGGTFTGGGAVACSAFFDGAAWTHQ